MRPVGLAAAGLIAIWACTEDPLALGPGAVPGAAPETRDVTISVDELGTWRDTTLTGFALPSNAGFVLISNRTGTPVRALGRFDVPDTIRTFVDTLPAATFAEVELLARLDTLRSEFGGFPLTLRVHALERPFDRGSATWERAAEGLPWSAPGGVLGPEIASAVLEAASDSVWLPVSVNQDSLMKAWRAEDGGSGFAIVLDGPESTVRMRSLILHYDPTLVGRTIPVPQVQALSDHTFIHDPPLPPESTALRVGGVPSSRAYLAFHAPRMLDGVSLEGGTVSQAEVILHPLAAPEPHAARRDIQVRKVLLLGDPWERGAKTPIGSGDAVTVALRPDSLAARVPLRLDITALVAEALQDSTGLIRFGLRGEPDAQELGYWEFGSIESPPEARPLLRVVFSSAPRFGVP